MKKNTKIIIIAISVLVVCVASAVVGYQLAPEKEVTKYVEVIKDSETMYDTSAIEVWGGHTEESGLIRMIGAWYYGTNKDGAVIVEDESGELWTLEGLDITDTQFLLLWITDNNTDNTKDDTIVKVWSEVHE